MTKRFENPVFPIKIDYTLAAEKILEERDKRWVLNNLLGFMDIIGADYAYVGASGGSLRVHLTWPPENRTERGEPP